MALNDLLVAAEASLTRLQEQTEALATDTLQKFTQYAASQAKLEALRIEIEKTEAAIAVMKGETPLPKAETPAEAPEEAPKEFYDNGDPVKKVRKKTGPYANIECNGCGQIGTLVERTKQLENGKVFRSLDCTSCKTSKPF